MTHHQGWQRLVYNYNQYIPPNQNQLREQVLTISLVFPGLHPMFVDELNDLLTKTFLSLSLGLESATSACQILKFLQNWDNTLTLKPSKFDFGFKKSAGGGRGFWYALVTKTIIAV